MTVPGPHACRAAADDLNTALGGDLKLTAFGPRLPELSRELELGDFFGRRVFGEPLLMAAFRGDAPGESDGGEMSRLRLPRNLMPQVRKSGMLDAQRRMTATRGMREVGVRREDSEAAIIAT